MNKRMRQGIGTSIGMVILLTAFTLAVIPDSVSARTWTVNSNGGGDFTTISSAVAASTTGDIIQVQPGSGYSENVNVNVAVTIIGVGGRPNVSPQSQNSPVFYVTSTGVTIEHLEIDGQNAPSVDGIKSVATAGEGNSVYFKDLIIYYCAYGVWIGPLSGTYPTCNYVENSTIYENSLDGVKIVSHPNPSTESQKGYHHVRECSIYDNNQNGVYISGDWNTIRNPDFHDNLRGVFIDGDWNNLIGVTGIEGSSHEIYDNIREGVHAVGDDLLIESYDDDLEIYSNGVTGYDGLYLDGDDATIEDCYVYQNGGNGIQLYTCNYCDVQHMNTYQNGGSGVYFYNSDNNDLLNVDSDDDTYGMFLNLSDSNEIEGCDFYYLDIAIKSVGSQDNDYFGYIQDDVLGYINYCVEAINATYFGTTNSTGRIKNYDINSGTGIYIEGIDGNNTSYFEWYTIPNESNLTKTLIYAIWQKKQF